LAGCDDLEPAPGLVLQRGLEVERPLLVRRQPVAAQAALWEPGQGVREPDRLGQGRTWLDESIGEAHAQGLVPRHTASSQDPVQGVTVADRPGEANGPAVDQRDAPP